MADLQEQKSDESVLGLDTWARGAYYKYMSKASNKSKAGRGQCFECRAAETEPTTPLHRLVVSNPDGGPARTGWLCEEHQVALLDDGYILRHPGEKAPAAEPRAKGPSASEMAAEAKARAVCPFCHEVGDDNCRCF